MMQKKFLLTTVALLIIPTHLLAAVSPRVAAGTRLVAKQNVAASQQPKATTYADSPAQPTAPALTSFQDRAKGSFYAGIGADMLVDRAFMGLSPKLTLGYGLFLGKSRSFYTALEVFGGIPVIPLSPNQDYRITKYAGIGFIPGYLINNTTMIYLRLGAQVSRYTNFNSTNGSGVAGIGFELYTYKHWDTRIEYSYAPNKSLNQYNIDFIYKFK